MGKTAVLAVRIISDAKGANAGLDQTSKKVGLLGKAGALAKAGLIAAAAAAVVYAGHALGMAGDLQQSVGAIDTVFGKSSAQMHQWAKNAAVDVGLTRNEFNELGTLIGTQLANGGTAMEDLGPKTKELITLGADLSSMFGGTTKDAVSALSSALKGERDPIERYGVSLKQATIDAKAAELGYQKVGGSLSNEAQQAATLALIMEQTSKAHGNFARETDTLAHQQQVAAAQFDNFTTSLGALLLPAATAVMGFFNTHAMPVLDKLAAAAGVLADLIGTQLAGAWAGLTRPTGQAAHLLTGVQTAAAGVNTWIADNLMPALARLGTALAGAFRTVAPIISAVSAQLQAGFGPALPIIQRIFGTLGTIITGALDLIGAYIGFAVGIWTGIWQQWGGPFISVLTTIWQAVLGVISPALDTISAIIATATAIFRGDWSAAWDGIKAIFAGAWATITAIITGAVRIVGAIIGGAITGITNTVNAGLGLVIGWIAGLGGKIRALMSGAGEWLKSAGADLVAGLWRGITGSYEWIKGKIRGWVGDVVGYFKQAFGINSPARVMVPLGTSLPEGLGLGVTNNMSAALNPIRRLSAAVTAAFVPDLALPPITTGGYPDLGRRLSSTGNTYITIKGALDPDAVANQIADLLNRRARRTGAVHIAGAVV